MNEQVNESVARSGRERRVSPMGRRGLADLGRGHRWAGGGGSQGGGGRGDGLLLVSLRQRQREGER